MLQLPPCDVGFAECPFVKDPDGGDVGQPASSHRIVRRQRLGLIAEEVQRTDDVVTESKRDGVHPAIAQLTGRSRETRPSFADALDIVNGHLLTGEIRVQARPCSSLNWRRLMS